MCNKHHSNGQEKQRRAEVYVIYDENPQAIDMAWVSLLTNISEQTIAYLSPADNVSRPLPYRLRRLNQPVMSPPNWFSIPRSTLLFSI